MEFDPGMIGKGVLIIMTHDVIVQIIYCEKMLGLENTRSTIFMGGTFCLAFNMALTQKFASPKMIFLLLFFIWFAKPFQVMLLFCSSSDNFLLFPAFIE